MDRAASDPRGLALWAVNEKIPIVAGLGDMRVPNAPVLAAIAEVCWWLASLDEDLDKEPGYKEAREADTHGALLMGLRWARHRHTHDLIATGEGDMRSAFNVPDGVIFISTPYVWRTVESMNLQGKSAVSRPDQRARYIERLEGNPVLQTIQDAYGWVEKAVTTYSH